MGHGSDLNENIGLQLYKDSYILELIDKHGHSSDYARTKKGTRRYKEEIADALSMVSYKNKQDKSTAIILVPVYDNNGKVVRRELLNYEEWHNRFEELATYLEKKISL